MRLYYVVRKYVSNVELRKEENSSLGIFPKGSSKNVPRPVVKAVQFKSVAHRSHSVGTGDVILSVCGRDSTGMGKRDVKRLLNRESIIEMQLEYNVRETRFGTSGVYRYQRMSVNMQKTCGTFGFILRKQTTTSGLCSDYPTITNLAADEDNYVMPGDRIVKIDGRDLSKLPLNEVAEILEEKNEVNLLVEYRVGVEDSSIRPGERTEVHLDCLDGNFGIVLAASAKDASSIVIEKIYTGSLAERCGAFRVGDAVLCINDISTAHLTAFEANALIHSFKRQRWKLIYVPSLDKMQLQREIRRINYETDIKCLKELPPVPRTTLLDQHQLIPPKNSPSSLYNWHFKKTHSVHEKSDRISYDFQTKTISMIKDVVLKISTLEQFIPFLNSNETLDKKENFVKVNPNRLSQLEAICTETKDSVREIAMHIIKNTINVSVLGDRKLIDDPCVASYYARSRMLQDLTENLTEIYTKKFITKEGLNTFLRNVSAVDFDCRECYPLCLSASLTVQKVVLLLSLNDQEWDVKFAISKLMMSAIDVDVPCNDCKTPWCSVSDSGKVSPAKEDLIKDYMSQLNEGGNQKTQHSNTVDPFKFMQNSYGTKKSSCLSNASNESKDSTFILSNQISSNEAEIGLDASKMSAFYSLTPKVDSETTSDRIRNNSQPEKQHVDVEQHGISNFPKLSNSSKDHQEISTKRNNPLKETMQRLLSGETIAGNCSNNCKEKFHVGKGCFATPTSNWRSEEFIPKDHSKLNRNIPFAISKHVSDPTGIVPKLSLDENTLKNGKALSRKSSSETSDIDGIQTECLLSSSNSTSRTSSFDAAKNEISQSSTMNIKLKDDGKGFGLSLGFLASKEFPVVLDLKPESAAAKIGVLLKGDRISSIDGKSTFGVTVDDLAMLTREAFAKEEVSLEVEFDVVMPEIRFGIFDICFDKSVKAGLVFKDMSKGSPLVVKGVVKGSAAHRCGQLFPGDEILFTNCIRQEAFDSRKCSYTRTDMVLMTVRRQKPEEFHPPSSPTEDSSSSTNEEFVLHRTSVHTTPDTKDVVLEQHLSLFRDKVDGDFGFLVGQNPKTGRVYVSGIRPGGPADKAKMIKKDMIVEIDGTLVGNAESSSLSLLLQAGDRLDLVTQRVLRYKEESEALQ